MRKIIRTGKLNWQEREYLQDMLNIARLPEFIIIETVEEEE